MDLRQPVHNTAPSLKQSHSHTHTRPLALSSSLSPSLLSLSLSLSRFLSLSRSLSCSLAPSLFLSFSRARSLSHRHTHTRSLCLNLSVFLSVHVIRWMICCVDMLFCVEFIWSRTCTECGYKHWYDPLHIRMFICIYEYICHVYMCVDKCHPCMNVCTYTHVYVCIHVCIYVCTKLLMASHVDSTRSGDRCQ